jgi:hypothetical protein
VAVTVAVAVGGWWLAVGGWWLVVGGGGSGSSDNNIICRISTNNL